MTAERKERCTQLELHTTIVDTIDTHLDATILNHHVLHNIAVAVAQGHNKRVHTIVLAIKNQASKAGARQGVVSSVANPVLLRREGGRVDDELASALVIGGSGLNASHIASVAVRVRERGTSNERESTEECTMSKHAYTHAQTDRDRN